MSWLADRLTMLLARRGQTSDALARQLAIERSRLSAIAAGTALPNDNLTRRLAQALGEDPEEWLAHMRQPCDENPEPVMPTGFAVVAAVSEIVDGAMKIVCDGRIVIANVAGRFYAFGN